MLKPPESVDPSTFRLSSNKKTQRDNIIPDNDVNCLAKKYPIKSFNIKSFFHGFSLLNSSSPSS